MQILDCTAPQTRRPDPRIAYFVSWYVLGAIAFAFVAMETRGRTIDEIDAKLSAPARPAAGTLG